jgi:hypothetical protein
MITLNDYIIMLNLSENSGQIVDDKSFEIIVLLLSDEELVKIIVGLICIITVVVTP